MLVGADVRAPTLTQAREAAEAEEEEEKEDEEEEEAQEGDDARAEAAPPQVRQPPCRTRLHAYTRQRQRRVCPTHAAPSLMRTPRAHPPLSPLRCGGLACTLWLRARSWSSTRPRTTRFTRSSLSGPA